MATNAVRSPKRQALHIEWVTLGLILLCSGVWAAALFWVPTLSPTLAAVCLTVSLVLHSSLTHEVLHGHPFTSRLASEALMVVNPGLAIPYLRFRDTHLAHHMDANLTDPYDDPESNYLDPKVWRVLPRWAQFLRRVNNTLAGRILLGPLIGQISFMASDWAAIRAGQRNVLLGWLLHIPGVILVLYVVAHSDMAMWLYCLSAYVALGILKIRTFLEHQAHERARGRTVIIEDTGPLAFLFLNNNLHMVHHMHPRVPWYLLPKLYAENRSRYLTCNEGYCFGSYAEVFRHYFFKVKDPVPHPLWPSDGK